MRFLITAVGCLFLLVPIILLFFLHADVAKLVTIICSLVSFSTVTAAFTSAKNWEVVAASVAYVHCILHICRGCYRQSLKLTNRLDMLQCS